MAESDSNRFSDVNPFAREGFGRAARIYARGRPDYPPELLDWLRGSLGLGPGAVAIDLGAGTGKFTRQLLRTGAQVLAVEPVAAMRAELAAALPAVPQVEGTAQAMDLAAASVDVVVCAQAFHWFATDVALAEIHRVLRPGGRLGLVWNVRDERVDWVAAITALLAPYEGDVPRYRDGDWRRLFPGRWFTALEEREFAHAQVGDPREVVLDRFLSVSFIAALAESERARVAAQLEALLASHPALRGRAMLAFPYRTRAYLCRRQEPSP